MHGRGLYEGHGRRPDRDPMARCGFLAEQDALQEELRAEIGGGAGARGLGVGRLPAAPRPGTPSAST